MGVRGRGRSLKRGAEFFLWDADHLCLWRADCERTWDREGIRGNFALLGITAYTPRIADSGSDRRDAGAMDLPRNLSVHYILNAHLIYPTG